MVIVLSVLGIYAIIGVAFAIAFILRGAGAIDAVARASPWHVRLIWFPGAAGLWPFLLFKWLRAKRGDA